MEVQLFFVLFTLGLASGFEFVIEPKSITALQGEAVILSCSVTGATDRGTIFWQRVNTGRYVSLNYIVDPYDIFGDDMKNRYRIIGDSASGEYTLLINDVRRSDIGRYACLYSEPSGAKTISRHATLSVLIPPGVEYPVCRMEPEAAVVGDEVDLICESEGGLPPATLTWFRGNKILPGKYGKAGDLTENRFRTVLEPTDRGVELICEASGIAIVNTQRTCTITPLGLDISVQIKPQVKVAHEGSRATFTCIAPGDMRDYQVYWLIGEEELPVEDPRMSFRDGHPRLRIDPVTLSEHGKIITCIVYDSYFYQGNASSVLFVTKTQITKEPSKNAIVFENEPASEQPTKISVVASVEGGPRGVFTAHNELPVADQATAGNPDAGVVEPSGSPTVSEQAGTKGPESPLPSKSTPKTGNDNPSMIFTNHFAMPTADTGTNETKGPVNRGDAAGNEGVKPTEKMTTSKDGMSQTDQPNNMAATTLAITDVTNPPNNEVELPGLQSDVNENEELDTNEAETDPTDPPKIETSEEASNNEAGKGNLEGTNSDKTAKENKEEPEDGQKIRIKIICSVLVVGVILIGFGFWRFTKSR